MNIGQWLTFGLGFLAFGCFLFFGSPNGSSQASFFLLGSNFMTIIAIVRFVGLIFGLLGVLFIVSGLLQNVKKIKIVD